MQAINVLFVALSISDTLLTVLVHPMIIATSFGHDPQDLFSHAGCNWYGFAAVFFGGTNMCIHGTIAYSRYVNILHYKERHNWTRLDTHLRILILCVTIALFFAAGKFCNLIYIVLPKLIVFVISACIWMVAIRNFWFRLHSSFSRSKLQCPKLCRHLFVDHFRRSTGDLLLLLFPYLLVLLRN